MKDLTVLIKPTSSLCNMRCTYCFYEDVAHRREVHSHGIMRTDILEVLIRRAFAFAERSITFVFQGGEPMLAGLDFFRRAVAYQTVYNARGVSVYNTIQTNGTLIDSDAAAWFARHRWLVGVSLDGDALLHDTHRRFPDASGSYERVIEGIGQLQAHGVEFNILAVISKQSAQAPTSVYTALREYRYLQFIPLIDAFDGASDAFSLSAEAYGRFLCEVFDAYYHDILHKRYVSIRDFDDYIQMLRGIPPSSCAMQGRCGGYFTVEADGSVYPCDYYVTDEHVLGNITEQSFFALAASERARRFIEGSAHVQKACRACAWFGLCRGGCRRYREPFPSLSKFCEAYRMFFAHCFPRMRQLAQLADRR